MNWRVAASTYWCWTAAAAVPPRWAWAIWWRWTTTRPNWPSATTRSRLRAWAAELPEDCAYRGCGTLWLAADAAELAEAERKRQALLAAGVACEMLDAARLRDLEPVLRPGLAGA